MADYFETGVTRTPAWHKLSKVKDYGTNYPLALEESGCDYDVDTFPIYRLLIDEKGNEYYEQIKSHNYVHHMGNGNVLGVVGSRWEPLQNRDAFSPLEPLFEEGFLTVESIISLKGGKIAALQGRLEGLEADVIKGDSIKGYMLISNGHDGSHGYNFCFTNTRVVCWNTLSAALRTKQRFQYKHTSNVLNMVDKLRASTDALRHDFEACLEMYQGLAKEKMNDQQLEDYFRAVLKAEEPEYDEEGERINQDPRALSRLLELHEVGAGADIPGVQGTMWGAYNAVSEWLSHERSRTAETTMTELFYGEAARVNNRALKIAVGASAPAAPPPAPVVPLSF